MTKKNDIPNQEVYIEEMNKLGNVLTKTVQDSLEQSSRKTINENRLILTIKYLKFAIKIYKTVNNVYKAI